MYAARYHTNGRRDRSFGGDGIIARRLQLGECCVTSSVAVAQNGAVYVGGRRYAGRAALVRLRRDGTIDRAFGDGGTASFAATAVGALAVDLSGRVLAAGRPDMRPESDFTVVRFTEGRLDPHFGDRGVVTTDFGGLDDPWALALQPDGKVVVAGYTGAAPFTGDFAVARLLPR